jgi:integral membrane protein
VTDAPTDRRIPGALARYRVMAIITGSFLLAVTAGVILKYAVGVDNPTFVDITGWIAIIHGWIYMVYLVTTVHLWLLKHWGLGRLVTMALGGIVPFLSFFLERRIADEIAAEAAPTEQETP